MFELEDQARDLLARTAQDIRNNGWHQGSYYPDEYTGKWSTHNEAPQGCPSCVYGAMIRVSGLTFDAFHSGGDDVVERAVGLLSADLREGISLWNDRPGQTADKVIGKLETLAGPEALARVNSTPDEES